jgi:hypothetical protein
MGTERFRHFNELATETTDLYLAGNYYLGAHELKFGLDISDNDIFNAFLSDALGNYSFRCENGTYSFGVVNCGTADAATVELAVLENFRNGTPSSYTVQAPNAGLTLADAAARFSLKNTGLFLQDTWKINPDLSVMVGVRMDEQGVGGRPLRNTNVALGTVAGMVDANGNVIARNSGGFGLDNTVTLDGSRLFQPRVGFNLKMGTPEQRMQLRGGFGLFQGSAAAVWLANPFSNTGVGTSSFSCSSFENCGPTGANVRFNPNPDNQPVNLAGTPPAANVDIISNSLEQPAVWKVNLAFDTELPPLPVVGRTLLGVEWVHTTVESALHYTHLNLGGATRQGTDGRNLFYSTQGFNPACWRDNGSAITGGACAPGSAFSRTRALSNPNFNDVLLASKTDKGRGNALTVSLVKPTPAEGIGWSVAYTKTTATEVNPLTSSRAISNWNGRVSFDPNEEVASNSNYLIKDRFVASLNWGKALMGSYRTTVGVFYESRRGKPYSWTYINDLNGDGIGGNDLMYIPSAPGSGEVAFRGGAAEEAAFWNIVDAHPELSAARGGVLGRNTSFNPWVNTFDVRFSQELPGFMKKHKAVFTLDVLNFGNLLNKEWGRTEEIGFPSNRSFVNYNGLNAEGKYIYSLGSVENFNVRQSSNESAWQLQATLRYEF